ncbi:MAG: molybdopterin-dependent oxidoreductase [Chloroflexi bacterium]|nr:molybdopterin-dependent oxidoreductase [Chloroflexota bacterium]
MVSPLNGPQSLAARGTTGNPKEDVWIHSACEMCYCSCGTLIHRVNGTVVKIEGDPDCPHNRGKLCAKGNAAIMGLYDPNRVRTPLKRTNPEKGIGVDPKWQEISWEEALDTVAQKLKKIRQEDSRKLVFAYWDVPYVFGTLFGGWMGAFGAPTYMLCAYRCGAAMHSASYETNNTFHNEVDLDYCNYLILFGNQMGFMVGLTANITSQKMAEARARGMKLVVIDPIMTTAAAKADEWVPIRPGTDGALALSMLHVLLNELGMYDAEFLKKYTNGPYLIAPDGGYLRDKSTNKPLVWDKADNRTKTFDADIKDIALEGAFPVDGADVPTAFQMLKDHVKKYTPESIFEITTVPPETTRRIAREYGQAARIGSSIVINGRELPYRPVAVNYYRGIAARKHGTLDSLSLYLLNFVVGAWYVPGGHTGVNIVGPGGSWTVGREADGLATPPNVLSDGFSPFNINVRPPERMSLRTLLPVSHSGTATTGMCLTDPEKFKIPVRPEMMMHCRTNLMQSRENLRTTTEAMMKIPFVVSFAIQLDETSEFADIVLPDTHALERLVLFPNQPYLSINTLTGYWYWGVVQPAVQPAGQARHYMEVLIELAHRADFADDFYRMLNVTLELKDEYKLGPGRKYSLEEIFDRWAKSMHGPEHGLEWFKEHGYLKKARTVEERYPLVDIKARFPIYFENYPRAGREVRRVTEKVGIPWDVSDYIALPEWRPNPSFERRGKDFDLYCINYKTPIHYQSFTAQNPWLNELADQHPYFFKVLINTETAKRKGIKEGDLIAIESSVGTVTGKARLTEGIHPEVVGIAGTFGAWAKGKPIARGKGVHHNSLLPYDLEHVDGVSGAVDDSIEVKVYKIEPHRGA